MNEFEWNASHSSHQKQLETLREFLTSPHVLPLWHSSPACSFFFFFWRALDCLSTFHPDYMAGLFSLDQFSRGFLTELDIFLLRSEKTQMDRPGAERRASRAWAPSQTEVRWKTLAHFLRLCQRMERKAGRKRGKRRNGERRSHVVAGGFVLHFYFVFKELLLNFKISCEPIRPKRGEQLKQK